MKPSGDSSLDNWSSPAMEFAMCAGLTPPAGRQAGWNPPSGDVR